MLRIVAGRRPFLGSNGLTNMSFDTAVPEVIEKPVHLRLEELRALRRVSPGRAALAILWTWI